MSQSDGIVIICQDGTALVEGKGAEYKRELVMAPTDALEIAKRSPWAPWREMFDFRGRDE